MEVKVSWSSMLYENLSRTLPLLAYCAATYGNYCYRITESILRCILGVEEHLPPMPTLILCPWVCGFEFHCKSNEPPGEESLHQWLTHRWVVRVLAVHGAEAGVRVLVVCVAGFGHSTTSDSHGRKVPVFFFYIGCNHVDHWSAFLNEMCSWQVVSLISHLQVSLWFWWTSCCIYWPMRGNLACKPQRANVSPSCDDVLHVYTQLCSLCWWR